MSTSSSSHWRAPPPCQPGDAVRSMDTPALVVDMARLEHNLQAMPRLMQSFPGVAVRPHAKAHKCPALAARQVELGAVGMCCQTLVEAESMVYGNGSKDILVSNQLIGKPKLRRLAALAKQAEVSICVDSSENILEISEVAAELGVNISCVVEINVGQDRCGVPPGSAAVELVKQIQDLPGVTFKGIQCYQGWNQHVRGPEERKKAVDIVAGYARDTMSALSAQGIECHYVTGGGTGTFPFEAGSGVFTEVQPGSYALMDVDYSKNFGVDGKAFTDFQHSLLVLTTVQSITAGDRAVVDAGMKAVSMDSGVPLLQDDPDKTYHIGGDEHGIIRPPGTFKVGDLLWLIPGHCDPTVNLYDWLVGIRGDTVEVVWPITGRGPGV